MKKRIVSLLLAVIMVISLLPATVLAEEITFGDLYELIGGQKFINSSDIVLSFGRLDSASIVTNFDGSTYTLTSKSNKVSVTSYGYHLSIRTSTNTCDFDFYVSGSAFTKVVVSGMERTERNDEYYPYNPVADYSAVTDALDKCKALKASDYTSDSWQALQDAINGVIYDLDADRQADVDAMAKAIMDAIDALEASHTHNFTGAYKDNGNGTHSRKCIGCDEYDTTSEAHSYTNGVCVCGAKEFVIENGVLTKYNGASGNVVVPNEVTTIGEKAFYGNKDITWVTMPNVTSVGDYAFALCGGLLSVSMPKVTTIGDSAFGQCRYLQTVEMPSVISIGNSAFYNCDKKFKEANMPNATSIGDEAFCACRNLIRITVTDKVKVGYDVFGGSNLNSVYYPCTNDVDAIKSAVNRNCTYSPIHDFTGDYEDNGNGTHSRKCTDCGEYGTSEAHSYTNGVCVCGAKDSAAELAEAKEAAISAIQKAAGDNMSASVNKILKSCMFAINHATTVDDVNAARDGGIKSIQDALAAAELDTAKKNAIAEINAKKNDENASVADAAIAAIENATSVAEVTNLLNQAYSDLDDLEVAKQRARYKEKISNELLPAAKCDEAKEIWKQALADLDNAETVSDMDSIMNNAEEEASNKDDVFEDWRFESNLYFKSALTDLDNAATDETKAFVTEMEQALADATSIAQVKDIFNNNKSKIDFYSRRDNMIAYLNECISSDESSDDMKAIAQECLNKVKTATTMDELDAITDEFEPRIELQEAKEDFIAECNEVLTSGEYSDEMKSLIQDMIEEVKAAETIDELGVRAYKTGIIFDCGEILSSDEYSDELKDIAQKICDEIKTATTADECDAVMDKYDSVITLQFEKDAAREEIKKLLPENASDAVKKIISDACAEIQANDDPDQYAEIIDAAKNAVEAQLQKEEELAPAKADAIEEINKAKTDANASVAEDAIKAINNAQSEDEISTLKEQALADMAKADAAADLTAAKESAIAAINAKKNDVNAAVADAAIADIEKATTIADVNNIRGQALSNMRAAEQKAEFKEKITNELIPAAKCDEAKEILNKALADLDNAVTINDVNSIFYNAQGKANGKDNEFEARRNGYTNMFNSLLTEIATDESKAYAADMKQALADATSIAQIEDIYQNNVSKVGLYYNRDKNVDGFNKYIDSDEYSDEMKAIAREAIEKLMQAESVSDIEEITKEYKLKLDVQEDKETMRGVLASDEYSDEMKDLAQDALNELDAVTTSQELTDLWDKYNPLMRLQLAKDDARNEVKELLPEDASDAVKKIVSDACDEIQANNDPDQYADIIEAASKAVEAQLQKEKELAPVKEAAIAEINDAKTTVNENIAEEAIKAINNAQSEDEISTLKEQALADMAATDAAAELAAAKEEAIAEINKAKSDANASVAEDAIKAINDATTVDEVSNLKDEALADMAAADAAAELAAAKEEAKKAIDNAVPADASDAVKAAAEKAKAAIDDAKSVEDVNTAKEAGIAAIEDQIAADTAAAELDAAKEEAKEAILAEQGDDTSEAVAKAVEAAIAAIDAATTIEDVNAAMEDGIAAIKDAKAGNVPSTPVTYTIIDGANSTWTKGSTSGLVVRSDAPFAKFVGVKVDGKTIAATNYTAKEGSTIITLTAAYLETLEVGTHTIEVVSTDGSASTNFTVKVNSQPADSTDPQTGDNSMIYLWTLILVVSATGLSVTTIYSRKRKIK